MQKGRLEKYCIGSVLGCRKTTGDGKTISPYYGITINPVASIISPSASV